MVLHGQHRGMMRRQSLVLDQISEGLRGACIPAGAPRRREYLPRPNETLAPPLAEPRTAVGPPSPGLVGNGPPSPPLAERALPIAPPPPFARDVATITRPPLEAPILKATVVRAIRPCHYHLHSTRLPVAGTSRRGRGRSLPLAGLLQLVGQRGGQLVQQPAVHPFLFLVLELPVQLHALVLRGGGRRHRALLALLLVHAQQRQQPLRGICAETVQWISCVRVRTLHPRFQRLPFEAIRNSTSSDPGDTWNYGRTERKENNNNEGLERMFSG